MIKPTQIDAKSIENYYSDLESRAHSEQGAGILTSNSGTNLDGHDIYFGVSFAGERQLLLPTGQIRKLPDLGMETLKFEAYTLEVDETVERYMILSCIDRSVASEFSYLVSEILNRVVQGFDGSAAILVRSIVSDWRKLLRAKDHGLTPREAIGLAGELAILEKLAAIDPVKALEAWSGSERALHDFRGLELALEVKAWRTNSAEVLFFDSYEQLEDPTNHSSLYLASVELNPNPDTASISERARKLVNSGVPRQGLRICLAKRGLVEFGTSNDEFRFEIESIKIWKVDAAFPRVRLTDLRPNTALRIRQLSYSLDMGELEGDLSTAEADAVLRKVLGS